MSGRLGPLAGLIRDVPDFPKPGVVFKDITPLLADPKGLHVVVDGLSEPFIGTGITKVIGIEARGFIVAAPVAMALAAGFIPVRKKGKLPWETVGVEYELEYGIEHIEMHSDALTPADRVLVVDDVLATGGTAAAAIDLVTSTGAEVAGVSVMIELTFLGGRSQFTDVKLVSLLTY